jgi:uncharacterized repeat protein (TIGR01451 family)
MNRATTAFALAMLIAAQATAALAQSRPNGTVQARLEAHKVVRTAGGSESLVPADNVKPGDVIEYVVTYRNTGAEAVHGLEATLPIPEATEFIAGSTRPAGAKASWDGATFEAMPLKRAATREGRAVVEAVPFRAYRFVRWYPGDLAAGQSVTFAARVKVIE